MKPSIALLPFRDQVAMLRPKVRAFALKLTKCPLDADDLAQDVLIKAIQSESKFIAGTNLLAWLLTITRNHFITIYNKKKKTMLLELADNPTSEQPSVFNSLETSQQSTVELSALVGDVQQALLKIDGKIKVPFLMFVQGYKYHEIAVHCSIPIGTVKNRIHICRQKLQGRLAMYA